jgi:hypothetical protein
MICPETIGFVGKSHGGGHFALCGEQKKHPMGWTRLIFDVSVAFSNTSPSPLRH